MTKNLFITFEGIDGSGKDTQLNKLVEQIREDDNYPFGDKYSNIWISREPTNIFDEGRQISRKIREGSVTKEEASKLYIEDRKKHSKLISTILTHSHVLCSRYDLSTLSYQMTQGEDFEKLYNAHNYDENNGVITPDITIVFTLPEDESQKRISQRNQTREFFEKREFQQQLENNLQFCIDELKKRGRTIIEINANQSIEKVTTEMFEKIASCLSTNY